jgi:outer membrane protein assembly factor BamD (BamD/ComL family)/pimeloyl-ACP methyl ester carboxylesterase
MQPFLRSRAIPGVILIAVLFAGVVRVRGDDGVPPEKATFMAGKETKILDPQTGGLGYYVVYVPKDYTPDRQWPTIFCYHGHTGDPTSWPFKDLTDGKGYIVVGMEYLDRENTSDVTGSIKNLERIRTFVESKLQLNPKLIFMGGFSQGGWSTSSFSNLYMDKLAGLVIMGAGGSPGAEGAKLLDKKPVFVGVGEMDPANKNARSASEAFKAKGADVTFEEFPGLAHNVDTKDKALKDWLLKWGPQNAMLASFNLAKAAEKAGKLGDAYNLYIATSKMSGGDEAVGLAKAISDPAEKKLADADTAMTAKKFRDAARIDAAVAQTYPGTPFAEKAKTQLALIKAEIDQANLDARAQSIEADAQTAEKAKDYARALTLYQTYVKQFPNAADFATVKAHLDALTADKSIQSMAVDQAAARECKGWLATADNYMQNSLNDKAKGYLQKILDKYPDTKWADEAKKRLAQIGS